MEKLIAWARWRWRVRRAERYLDALFDHHASPETVNAAFADLWRQERAP